MLCRCKYAHSSYRHIGLICLVLNWVLHNIELYTWIQYKCRFQIQGEWKAKILPHLDSWKTEILIERSKLRQMCRKSHVPIDLLTDRLDFWFAGFMANYHRPSLSYNNNHSIRQASDSTIGVPEFWNDLAGNQSIVLAFRYCNFTHLYVLPM